MDDSEPMFEDCSHQGCYVFQPSATSGVGNDDTKDTKQKPKQDRRADVWPRLCAGTEPEELVALRHDTYRRLWHEAEGRIDPVIDAVDGDALAKIRHFCPNLPTALKTLIRLAIDDDPVSTSPDHYAAFVAAHKHLIPMPFDLELLQRYLDQQGLSRVVVVLPEIESFDVSLVADLVHHLSLWSDRIPFSLVLGISTTIDLFEARLSKTTIRLLHVQPFSLSPHADPLYPILLATHHPPSTLLFLGPSVLSFLVESTHNQSTTPPALKRIIKYAFMSHFFANPLSTLLCHEAEHATLHKPTNQAFLASLLRNTPSFRAYCSNLLHLNTKDAAERVYQLLISDADTLDHAISSLAASTARLRSAYTAVDAFVQLYIHPAIKLSSPSTPPSELYVQLSQHLLPGPKTKAVQSTSLYSDLMSALRLLPPNQISDIFLLRLTLATELNPLELNPLDLTPVVLVEMAINVLKSLIQCFLTFEVVPDDVVAKSAPEAPLIIASNEPTLGNIVNLVTWNSTFEQMLTIFTFLGIEYLLASDP
ncbi:hypothetical protein DV736_g2449, partial [Chaetothyriales sp. CBS 134916]